MGTVGVFYSVDFDFVSHTGRLVKVDPATGIGAVVGGSMGFDVKVGGLAYDEQADTLYAVTLAHGSRGVELLTIDRGTGLESVIGATGTPASALQSLGIDTASTPAKLFAAGTQLYELNTATGQATLVGGSFSGTVWGMASAVSQAAEPVPEIKVNGSGGAVSLGTGDTLSLEIGLSAGSHTGVNADWWVVEFAPDGWYYYSPGPSWIFAGSSLSGVAALFQGALFDLDTLELFNQSGLSAGQHIYVFAIDTEMNGLLDFDKLYFDHVEVTVK